MYKQKQRLLFEYPGSCLQDEIMAGAGIRYLLVVLLLTALSVSGFSQSSFLVPSESPDIKRRNGVYIGYAAGMTLSYAGLYQLWYRQNGLSGFTFLNDNSHWMGMDKAGHMTTAYQLGRYGTSMLRWAGVDHRSAAWQGGLSGFIFLAGIEIFDGFSDDYGFSAGDLLANAAGSAAFIGQELGWGEQRILVKYSYSPSSYAQYRPELLGERLVETWLKDYNGMTYWLSVSPGSFGSGGVFPDWLCLSVGYSANGMTGAHTNPDFNGAGEPVPQFTRYGQYFFSLDVDLSKLNPRSPLLKTLFSAVGFVKFPFSALEYNRIDGMRFRPLHF